MKMEPRRKERAMQNPEEMKSFLDRMPVGHMALTTEDGPYVVPVNYHFSDGFIHIHSGTKGRKIEALQRDPRVCFLVDEAGPQARWNVRCGITQIYQSVMCFGRAEFVEGLKEKRRILEMMLGKFLPPGTPFQMAEGNIAGTTIIRIKVEWMTGKVNRLSPLHTVIPTRTHRVDAS